MKLNAGNNNEDHTRYEGDETQKTSSSLCTQDKLALSSWGLPEKVQEHYASKGITHMFNWQLECLTIGKVLEGGNLVYSAPTSAGKTLVAEILMAQTIFEQQKKVMLILPFVSVVREKMFYFQDLFSMNGIKVEGFMGGHSPSGGFKQVHMSVCTIEKANSIVNRLLEEKNLNSLGLVVVDELHLLGDPYRGYLLELLLTKLKYMSLKLKTNIQIVGMSATLPNLKVLANWLNADLYYTTYRPVPLLETLKCGNCIYDKKLNKLREVTPYQSDIPDCSDHIGQLCLETIQNGHSVLIFCPSKVWCENLAAEIALFFKQHGFSKSAMNENTPGWIVRKQINLEKNNQVIEHLKMTPAGADPNLQRTIAVSVAFHHAGLTLDERDIIEGSFRKGAIRVLCATSTLSSGVNLPARRVIIRSPFAFGNLLDILSYRQMIGRAGRMGVDSEGESILMCKPNEKLMSQKLMTSNLKPIESCLGRELLSSSLKRALLEVVASGIASTPDDVQEYANCTFLASSSKHNIQNPISSCIEFLEENEFIRLQDNGTKYTATPLGQACLASSLPPDEGLSLFRELQRARRCFVLDTDLHIIYQVTPYSVSEQWTKLDWLQVLQILETIPESMKRVGELVGIEESFLVRIAKGRLNPNIVENRIKLSIHRRFYTALALQDLVNEVPLTEVAEKYMCNKGMLQSLQQSAATYAGMVTEFTRKLGWGSLEIIFSQFQERLQFGVQRDLCELMRLSSLNVIRARALHKAGYTNLVTLANANATDLENVLYSSIPFQTKKDIAGETSYERIQRNKLQTIWITGQADLSVRKAAELLIEQARSAVEMEMGVQGVNWGDHTVIAESSLVQELEENTIEAEGLEEEPASLSEAHKELNYSKQEEEEALINNSWVEKATQILEPNIRHDDRSELLRGSKHSPTVSCDMSMSPIKKGILPFGGHLKGPEFRSTPRTTLVVGDISLGKGVANVSGRNMSDYFTTSFNLDNILNFTETTEKYSSSQERPVPPANVNTVDESDNSVCSESSVEIVYERSTICDTSIKERLSGDMFAMQEVQETPATDEDARPRTGVSNTSKICEIPAELFSESLTFDTQMQRILDVDAVKDEAIKNRSDSDDLGFVSDVSPFKMKHDNELSSTYRKASTSAIKRFIQMNSTDAFNFISTPTDDRENDDTPSKAVKRKNCNSPDYIIGSDDSFVEDGHTKKKAKIGSSNQLHLLLERFKDVIHNDRSDNEIMPTPKGRTDGLSSTALSRGGRGRTLGSRSRSVLHGKGTNDFTRRLVSSGSAGGHGKATSKGKSISIDVKRTEGSNDSPRRNKFAIVKNLTETPPTWDKINIVDVSTIEETFEFFCEELKLRNIIGLALSCRKVPETRRRSIGANIKKTPKTPREVSQPPSFVLNDVMLDGIAFYCSGSDVFYLNFDSGSITLKRKLELIIEISTWNKTLRMFDAKEQIKSLHQFMSVFLEGSYQDPKTACWLLSKSWKEKAFSSVVIDHIPEATKLTAQLGPLLGFSGPGTYVKSSVPAQTRACLEAFLTYHVMERQLKLLHGKSLLQLFQYVEMPLVPCLAELELVGFKFDRDKLIDVKGKLDSVQSQLSDKAYSFAQYKFALTSPAAISKLLYNELKLGKSDSFLTRKHQKPSTNKEALQELAIETNHPLPDIILDWRKIQSVLSKVLGPILQVETNVSRLYSLTQTYTSTGRLAMHEPNLQNIPRNFNVNFGNIESDISIREIFVPSDGYTLLTADYSQIELRMLAHLSGDELLMESIKKSNDVFVSIASHIYGVGEKSINDELRQQTKRTCYGIIYGIGARALSRQLRVEETVALGLMDEFKTKYKGVTAYLENILKDCQTKGYVKSLFGRRRYLSYINDSNAALKAEAERQAINTTIQGSAADLIKIAMIKIRQRIKMEFKTENAVANLLLHLHDELIFEVRHDYVETVAVILKDVMESAIELKVPTPVKFHTGPSWGQLRPYEI